MEYVAKEDCQEDSHLNLPRNIINQNERTDVVNFLLRMHVGVVGSCPLSINMFSELGNAVSAHASDRESTNTK